MWGQLWLPDVSDSWWGLQAGMQVSSRGFGMVREGGGGGEIGIQKKGGFYGDSVQR